MLTQMPSRRKAVISPSLMSLDRCVSRAGTQVSSEQRTSTTITVSPLCGVLRLVWHASGKHLYLVSIG
jgi:hypothetical protein